VVDSGFDWLRSDLERDVFDGFTDVAGGWELGVVRRWLVIVGILVLFELYGDKVYSAS
jgi:hypothetical protein